jgi:hypothetical protein
VIGTSALLTNPIGGISRSKQVYDRTDVAASITTSFGIFGDPLSIIKTLNEREYVNEYVVVLEIAIRHHKRRVLHLQRL